MSLDGLRQGKIESRWLHAAFGSVDDEAPRLLQRTLGSQPFTELNPNEEPASRPLTPKGPNAAD